MARGWRVGGVWVACGWREDGRVAVVLLVNRMKFVGEMAEVRLGGCTVVWNKQE